MTMFYTNITISTDDTYTWRDWRVRPLGAKGDFNRPVICRRFGTATEFVVKERVTDDCRADLIAASVQTEQGGP